MPAGADHCAAVCCAKSKVVSCVNGPGGGRIVATSYQGLPFDLIQEWGFGRPSIDDWGKVDGERIVHAVADSAKTSVVGITTRSLFVVDVEKGKPEVIGEVPGKGRVALGSKGGIFGKDTGDSLWRYDSAARKLARQAVEAARGRLGQARRSPGPETPATACSTPPTATATCSRWMKSAGSARRWGGRCWRRSARWR